MTWRTVAVILLTLLNVAAARATTTAQYDSALAQVQAALEARIPALTAHEIPSGQPPQFVARRLLAPITSVGSPGEPQQVVSNAPLLRALAAAERAGNVAQMKALDRQIRTLRAEVSAATTLPPAQPNAIPMARAILAQPEYGSTPFPPPPLSDRIARWLDEQLSKIHWPHAPRVNGPNINFPSISPVFIRSLLFLVIGGAAAVLVFVIVQWLSRSARRRRGIPLIDEAEQVLVEARDSESLLALAERQAKAGDYRRAFRLIYLATLIALDTGGVLRFHRARTNWEYLRSLRASGREDVYRAMMPLTREFDRIWYGFAPAGPAEYARAVAQYHALQSAPQATAQAAAS